MRPPIVVEAAMRLAAAFVALFSSLGVNDDAEDNWSVSLLLLLELVAAAALVFVLLLPDVVVWWVSGSR